MLPPLPTACNRMLAGAGGKDRREDQRFQRLKAAIEVTVHDLLAEVGADTEVKFSAESSAAVAELAIEKTVRSAGDLAAFAQHAKRQVVTAEDVKLLTRRNPELNARLTALSREQSEASASRRVTGKSKKSGKGGDGGEAQKTVAGVNKAAPAALID